MPCDQSDQSMHQVAARALHLPKRHERSGISSRNECNANCRPTGGGRPRTSIGGWCRETPLTTPGCATWLPVRFGTQNSLEDLASAARQRSWECSATYVQGPRVQAGPSTACALRHMILHGTGSAPPPRQSSPSVSLCEPSSLRPPVSLSLQEGVLPDLSDPAQRQHNKASFRGQCSSIFFAAGMPVLLGPSSGWAGSDGIWPHAASSSPTFAATTACREQGGTCWRSGKKKIKKNNNTAAPAHTGLPYGPCKGALFRGGVLVSRADTRLLFLGP